jgi:hypothetical protein
MSRILQEFYCGECNGFFRAPINVELNIQALIECPECKHQHHRFVKDGHIYESGRGGTPVETILVPKTAYSKEPITKHMQEKWNNGRWDKRNGIELTPEEEFRAANRNTFFMDRWAEKAATDRGE